MKKKKDGIIKLGHRIIFFTTHYSTQYLDGKSRRKIRYRPPRHFGCKAYFFLFCIFISYLVFLYLRLYRSNKIDNAEEEPPNWCDEYPRPLMRRNSFICLNGPWEIRQTEPAPDVVAPISITVPFPPESELSGLPLQNPLRQIHERKQYTYHTHFRSPRLSPDECLILHFGAVDQVAIIKINHHEVMTHEGGYLPFEVDITAHLRNGNANNLLEVVVTDWEAASQPRWNMVHALQWNLADGLDGKTPI